MKFLPSKINLRPIIPLIASLALLLGFISLSASELDVAQGHSLQRQFTTLYFEDDGNRGERVIRALDPATVPCVVTSTADSGPGSLREALNSATCDWITFNPSVFPPGSPTTIFVQSALPALGRNGVTIDASDAGVILDGSSAPVGTKGVVIEADDCVIRGLAIQNFSSDGISIPPGASNNTIGGDRGIGVGPNGQGNLIVANGGSGIEIRGDDNLVQGNYIGIDGSGRWDRGNTLNGVALWNGASRNTVGGTSDGYRNVISGNDQNGVWIGLIGTDENVVIGNYIGTRADGMGAVANDLSGVAIQGGAQGNRIGGTTNGAGNLISGNQATGVYISDLGSDDNQVLGNMVGPKWQGTDAIGQGDSGVAIIGGARRNKIGDGSTEGRNIISGNSSFGVLIRGSDTMSNTVQGNFIGTNADGDARLKNGEEGVRLDGSAHDNRVQGNVISGNGSDGYGNGLVIVDRAHHNMVRGNYIGTDKTGTFAVGGQPGGGIDVTGGAQYNTIGGINPTPGERCSGDCNLISGNGVDGIFIEGSETQSNTIQGNYIGTNISGTAAIPNTPWGLFILNMAPNNVIVDNLISGNVGNGMEITYGATASEIRENQITQNGGAGIHFTHGASQYQVISNTISGNGLDGVWMEDGCNQNRLARNSIYDNGGKGIQLDGNANGGIPAPTLTAVTMETITGTTRPNARVEFFSDDDEEGRVYEGYITATVTGAFSFTKPGGFVGPNVMATGTDASGNTTELSQPVHFLWTLLLFLNGDNDLEEYMFDTVDNIAAAGPSPRANVLALVDGYTTTMAYSGTVLYDLTYGTATPLTSVIPFTGELNMGDGQTLVDFVNWGRAHYPSRYTFLSIVDHGGGWAPGPVRSTTGNALFPHEHAWTGGVSGLSWDFTDNYDYLESPEIRQALAVVTSDGADPLDVLFYDVCLMGLTEVAYQIQEYAGFFVSSQNIGWAPVGPQGRYVRLIQEIGPTTTPHQLAQQTVRAYADSMPLELHPFTVSAVDLAQLPALANAVHQLAVAISDMLTSPIQLLDLTDAYSAAQKLDYDSDFAVEPDTDGFVDLYDFALQASQQFTNVDVILAAQSVTTVLSTAVVAEQHRSGAPWIVPTHTWGLTDVHGLSIFLPLGEDLEFPVVITETSPITPGLVVTRQLRMRDMYTDAQLQFVGDAAWGTLIDTYYDIVASPIPTDATEGPVDGLKGPDITPPQTTITVTGEFAAGHMITVTWVATDTQSGVSGAALWRRPSTRTEYRASSPQSGLSGAFTFRLPLAYPERCLNSFAVRAVDMVNNEEPFENDSNTQEVFVKFCPTFLPVTMKHWPDSLVSAR